MKVYVSACLGLAVLIAPRGVSAEKSESVPQKPKVIYRELFSQKHKLGEQSVTCIRVAKPNLPPIPTPPQPRSPTLEEQIEAERQEAKEHLSITISATVFSGKRGTITQLRWQEGEKAYVAYSNIDFRFLNQLCTLETDRYIIEWFPFVDICTEGDVSANEWQSLVPNVTLGLSQSEYAVDMTEAEMKSNEHAFLALDAVHAYYDKHADELKRNYLRIEKENALREAELLKNPPKKPDTIIHFWPVKSQLNVLK